MKLFLCVLTFLQVCFIPSLAEGINATSEESLYEEAIPLLSASKLVYTFATLLKESRANDNVKLIIPDGFPVEIFAKYKDESIDFRDIADGVLDNNGDGMPFNVISSLLTANADNLAEIFPNKEELEFIVNLVKRIQSAEDEDMTSDSFFLETFRSIQSKVSCVYGILKDKKRKHVIITFRGSQNPDFSTRDWRTNLYGRPTELRTPKAIKDKMKGKLKDRVLVHKGFYNYLFNNKRIKGEQRYDQILADIKPLVQEGYKIYVTGHSLGAALSTMAAFKLAGEEKDWIPKPITCISYASPFVGSAGFRTAHEELEKGGHLRHLRVTNDKDFVPTVPPFFLSIFKFRPLKHVGINLRLKDGGFEISHPSGNGVGLTNAIKNSVLKPLWALLHYHQLILHDERMNEHLRYFMTVTIDELYKDNMIVGNDFLNVTIDDLYKDDMIVGNDFVREES